MDSGEDIRALFRKHRQGTMEVIRDAPVTDDLAKLTMIVDARFTGVEDAFVYVAQQIEMLRADLERGH